MKTITKSIHKHERERQVLLGLVECYILTGRPVGSSSLKEAGFENLSSATIRNYFASLERDGFLIQQHTSGGRIPTAKAYRLYAEHALGHLILDENDALAACRLKENPPHAIAMLLQQGAEQLAARANMALFLSSPRFDQDYVTALKLLPIDSERCLCVVVTDFGVVRSELLYVKEKISAVSARRIESYFQWRIRGTGYERPENLTQAEEILAPSLYNEVMVRYLVNYTNFVDEEIYRTGLSNLLVYPEMQHPEVLSYSLALFENTSNLRQLLREGAKSPSVTMWIEGDLLPYSPLPPPCAIFVVPYCIKQQPVGALGLLGPMRVPYRRIFALLKAFSEAISEALTQAVYKHKIAFRTPNNSSLHLENSENLLIGHHIK